MALGNLASRFLVAVVAVPILLLALYQRNPVYTWALIFAASLVAMAELFAMTLADKTDRAVSLGLGALTVAAFYWMHPLALPQHGAWLVLASEEAVKRHGLEPIGRILDSEWAGLDPAQMGLGPVHAATPILKRHGLKLDSVDYWEINEAFAAQVLGCLAAWKDEKYCKEQLGLDTALGDLDQEKLNVDGGAVALGHPVGASGARIVLHMLKLLKRKNAKRGMASICIGGGLGGAMLVEAL